MKNNSIFIVVGIMALFMCMCINFTSTNKLTKDLPVKIGQIWNYEYEDRWGSDNIHEIKIVGIKDRSVQYVELNSGGVVQNISALAFGNGISGSYNGLLELSKE